MPKIFCLMGKSASGKDAIYKRLIEAPDLELKKMRTYTTRPIREGERDGEEYFFTDAEGFAKAAENGKIIELREYNTVQGVWRYFTVDDECADIEYRDSIIIGTIDSFRNISAHYGKDKVVPILIETDDRLRLLRSIEREQSQTEPKYAEICRRFLADEEDFSAERKADAGIDHCFYNNDDLEKCLSEIINYIKSKRYVT